MYWHPSKFRTFAVLAAALLLATGATAAAAADVLVVRAVGPSAKSFPAGKSIADSAKIVLKQNDMLVLLDAGGTRTLRGPGTFSPHQSSPPNSAPTVLAANTAQPRARIGAVRGAVLAKGNTSVWNLDVSKDSTFCVANPTDLALWRADASQTVALTITRPTDGHVRTIDWAAGQATMKWPTDLPINDGAAYRFLWKGAAAPTAVKFRTLSRAPQSVNDMATSLIQHGCEQQLDVLIASVPEARNAPSG